ncbi:MAG: pimeloyl-ACP methyl ester carboxylesterase [Pseudomonadales bacterium]|jgi:pimeloyl-ACP methyl ester carboxylesterase
MTNSDIVDLWVGSHDLPAWFTEAMAVPREEGFAQINSHKVHYFRWGKRGNPPLLITHGFLAHARCFAFIAPFFAEEYDIVAYDLAGMGDSDAQPGRTNAERGEDMVAAAEKFDMFDGPVNPIIIAHSFGGGVGLSAMEHAGERFSGLIICDLMVMRPEILKAIWKVEGLGRPGSGNPHKRNNIYPDYETARARYVLSPQQSVKAAFLLDYMAYHSLCEVDGGWTWKFDPQVFTRVEEDQQNWLQTAQRIADLEHKAVIIYEEKSSLFDADSIEYIKEVGGSHVPMIAVPDAEHHLMLDQPMVFVTALRCMLALW